MQLIITAFIKIVLTALKIIVKNWTRQSVASQSDITMEQKKKLPQGMMKAPTMWDLIGYLKSQEGVINNPRCNRVKLFCIVLYLLKQGYQGVIGWADNKPNNRLVNLCIKALCYPWLVEFYNASTTTFYFFYNH